MMLKEKLEKLSSQLSMTSIYRKNSLTKFSRTSSIPEGQALSEAALEKMDAVITTQQKLFLKAILSRDEQEALRLGTSCTFIDSNSEFVSSGTAIVVALENQMLDLSKYLISVGYTVPPKLLIRVIENSESFNLRFMVENKLYSESTLELGYYLLLKNNFESLAEILKQRHDQLKLLAPDSKELRISAIVQSLQEEEDDLACIILVNCPAALTVNMVELALKHSCISFLRRVWTGNLNTESFADFKKKDKNSAVERAFRTAGVDSQSMLKISSFIKTLLKKKGNSYNILEILNWPGAVEENGLMLLLIQEKQEDLAKEIVFKVPETITAELFAEAFSRGLYSLCLDMLYFKEPQIYLSYPNTQKKLVKLLKSGSTCAAAMEMLALIGKKIWKVENTRKLCITLSAFAKKTEEIILCHKPLLFCGMAVELLLRVSTVSLQYQNRCLSTAKIFTDLGIKIESSIKDEEELKHLLMQQDIKGRTVLTILSKNRFYTMLENDAIGSIVTKLWIGDNKNYGILASSSIVNSFHAPYSSEEAMQFSRGMDVHKPYMFHYDQWEASCSLRFIAQAVSIIILVFIYQMVVYTAISEDSFHDVSANYESMVYLRIAQTWVSGIMVEQLLHITFGLKTDRGYHLDNWRILDFAMFGLMITLMMELHERFMGEDKLLHFINPELFNAGLHSAMMVLIWLKFMSVLITSKRFGPFLRMIYLMIGKVVTFFVIFLCLAFCSAAVFTSLFNRSSSKFQNFPTSARTLFAASLASFDLMAFDENIALGGFLLGVYLLIANVMFLNLLIAMLSNVYSDLIVRVDSEHRAVVIRNYNRFRWDKRYGFLIFLPPPFTFVALLFAPLVLFTKDKEYWNHLLCRVFYTLYGIPQFLIFLVSSAVYSPFLYLKGFVIYGKRPHKGSINKPSTIISFDKEQSPFSDDQQMSTNLQYRKVLAWLFIGIPWITYAYLRDLGTFWIQMYVAYEGQNDDFERLRPQQMVNRQFIEDVQIVLGSLRTSEVTVHHFVEAWNLFDQIHFEPDASEFLSERKQQAYEYFTQFANNSNDPVINVQRMRKLIPERELYTEEYLLCAQHVNVPWLRKAVKKYQQKIGTAKPNQQEEKRVDHTLIAKMEQSVKELQVKYIEVFEASTVIRDEMEAQTQTLKNLLAQNGES